MIGLLHPHALWLLGAVPALLIPYLIRQRPTSIVVSSVIAFRALAGARPHRMARPRLDWMFFVELALLSLAVLAIAGPYVNSESHTVAVVIENSAASQAKTGSGRSRFAAEIAALAPRLRSLGGADKVTVFVTAPRLHPIAPAYSSPSDAMRAISELTPSDAPDDPQAVSQFLDEAVSGARFTNVIFAGYRQLKGASAGTRVQPIVVGSPEPNFAIGEFAVRRGPLGSGAMRATVTVGNFSPSAQALTVTISGDHKPIASAKARLDPGAADTIELPQLPAAQTYSARLTPEDGLAVDNVAYATAGATKSISILFITPAAADAQGLATLPGVSVRTVSPEAYTPADLARADLAVFEYSAPKEMPGVNSLMVMPPPDDRVFDFVSRPVNQAMITGWLPTDPLIDAVNVRLLNLHAGEEFAPHPWMQPVLNGVVGGLLLRGRRQGHRFVATGFNPFPYLGEQNLPMSVLTLNILSYLAGFGANGAGYHTGEPWLVPAGVTQVVLPTGQKVPVRAGTLFTNVSMQGIYKLVYSDGSTTARAVNLADFAESDLQRTQPVTLKVAPTNAATVSSRNSKQPLGGYLLGAIIALGALEAILGYRRRRPRMAESAVSATT